MRAKHFLCFNNSRYYGEYLAVKIYSRPQWPWLLFVLRWYFVVVYALFVVAVIVCGSLLCGILSSLGIILARKREFVA